MRGPGGTVGIQPVGWMGFSRRGHPCFAPLLVRLSPRRLRLRMGFGSADLDYAEPGRLLTRHFGCRVHGPRNGVSQYAHSEGNRTMQRLRKFLPLAGVRILSRGLPRAYIGPIEAASVGERSRILRVITNRGGSQPGWRVGPRARSYTGGGRTYPIFRSRALTAASSSARNTSRRSPAR